jgi:uncharacterized membrane protein YqhA
LDNGHSVIAAIKQKKISMKAILLILKVIIIIICSVLLISAIAFVVFGVYAESQQIVNIFSNDLLIRRKALLSLLEVVDIFLIALVLIILSLGLAQLFMGEHIARHSEQFRWLHFHNFTELKLVLWKMIMTTILVSFFVILYERRENLEWELLIFPASILLISISLYLVKGSKDHSDK